MPKQIFIEDKNAFVDFPDDMSLDEIDQTIQQTWDKIPQGRRGFIGETATGLASGTLGAMQIGPMLEAVTGQTLQTMANEPEGSAKVMFGADDSLDLVGGAVRGLSNAVGKTLGALHEGLATELETEGKVEEAQSIREGLKNYDPNVLAKVGGKIAAGGIAGMKYYAKKQEKFQPEAALVNETLIDNPSKLLDPNWWGMSLGQMVPSVAAAVLTGIATGGSSSVMQASAAGATAGLMEGASTTVGALESGMSKEEAIDKGAHFAVLSGILNTAGFEQWLNPKGRKAVSRFLIGYGAEGFTEGLEEPTESLVLNESGKEFVEALKRMPDVGVPAGLLGGAGALVSRKGKVRNEQRDNVKKNKTVEGKEQVTTESWLEELEGQERQIEPVRTDMEALAEDFKSALAPDEIRVLRESVENLGSVEAVGEKFTGTDAANEFARRYATQIYDTEAQAVEVVEAPEVGMVAKPRETVERVKSPGVRELSSEPVLETFEPEIYQDMISSGLFTPQEAMEAASPRYEVETQAGKERMRRDNIYLEAIRESRRTAKDLEKFSAYSDKIQMEAERQAADVLAKDRPAATLEKIREIERIALEDGVYVDKGTVVTAEDVKRSRSVVERSSRAILNGITTVITEEGGFVRLPNNALSNADVAAHRKAVQKVSSAWDTVLRATNIVAAYENKGAPKTGEAIRRHKSAQEAEVNYGTNLSLEVRRLSGGNPTIESLAVFAAEDENFIKKVPKKMREQVQRVADVWLNYATESLERLHDLDILRKGFEENVKARIENEIAKTPTSEANKLNSLRRALKDAERLRFVHIPTMYWFESMIGANPEVAAEIVTMLTSKRRDTLRIRDLVDVGLLHPEDISMIDSILSYSRRLGKDLALKGILDAAQEEGLAYKQMLDGTKRAAPEGRSAGEYVDPPANFSMLHGWKVDPILSRSLEDIYQVPRLGIAKVFDTTLSYVKGFQFIKPGYLPMMDIMQAVHGGTISGLPKHFKQAYTEVMRMNEGYMEAERLGLFSTITTSPYSDIISLIERVKRVNPSTDAPINSRFALRKAEIMQAKNLLPHRAILESYGAMHDFAWTFDKVVRMSSYHYLLEQGYSKSEAAKHAATIHGDYANIPTRSRRILNRMFFTPSFKVSMAKMLTQMVRGTARTVMGKGNKTDANYAKGMAMTFALLGGMDMALMGLGFEREKPLWKYKKRVQTDKGVKELVIGMNTPFTLGLKYIYRMSDAVQPGRESGFATFLENMKWEFHPVYRMAYDGLVNKRDRNFNRIYSDFDDPAVKAGKLLGFFVQESVPLIEAIKERGNLLMLGEPEMDGNAEARAKLQEEIGRALELLFSAFAFSYLRDPVELRKLRQLRAIKTQFSQQLREAIMNGETEGIDTWIENYQEKIEKVVKELEGRDE